MVSRRLERMSSETKNLQLGPKLKRIARKDNDHGGQQKDRFFRTVRWAVANRVEGP